MSGSDVQRGGGERSLPAQQWSQWGAVVSGLVWFSYLNETANAFVNGGCPGSSSHTAHSCRSSFHCASFCWQRRKEIIYYFFSSESGRSWKRRSDWRLHLWQSRFSQLITEDFQDRGSLALYFVCFEKIRHTPSVPTSPSVQRVIRLPHISLCRDHWTATWGCTVNLKQRHHHLPASKAPQMDAVKQTNIRIEIDCCAHRNTQEQYSVLRTTYGTLFDNCSLSCELLYELEAKSELQ